MSEANVVLAEPLTLGQARISRGNLCGVKAVVFLSLLAGFVCAVLFGQMRTNRSEIVEPAIDLASMISPACQPHMKISPAQMQDVLHKYGKTPMARVALTSYAATRDVSMMAQAKKEVDNLDPMTKTKLKSLTNEMFVRASKMAEPDISEVGVTQPLGFFDPLDFSDGGTKVAAYRAAELKHGRVCMIGTLGIIVSEVFHPIFDAWGEGEFVSAAGSHFVPSAANFWIPFFVLTAGIEILSYITRDKDTDLPQFDPYNLKSKDPEEYLDIQNREINNGRLAMFALSGILAQELVTGEKVFR